MASQRIPNPTLHNRLSTSTCASAMSSFVSGNKVLTAEIFWTLDFVQQNHSFKSSERKSILFKKMFAECEVASKFACGERKCAYLTTFGIAPYFSSLLVSKVKSASDYVLLFDDSLNTHLQAKQMTVHVRFWEDGQVATRFYTDEFLIHASADNLHDKLKDACSSFGTKGLLQLAMDGPNINWKVFDLFEHNIAGERGQDLINIGSCGFHIVHNAFRLGSTATDWDMEHILTSLLWLFKDCPARREDFTQVTGSCIFPKRFCSHRWVENVDVVERVIVIWPDVEKCVTAVKQGKVTHPKCKSFGIVAISCTDSLFLLKVNNFLSIDVLRFLSKYQTDAPMVPFLDQDIRKTIRILMDNL